jgi:hypothetical protein
MIVVATSWWFESGQRQYDANEAKDAGLVANARTQSIDRAAHDLLVMFDALLKALTGESAGRAA